MKIRRLLVFILLNLLISFIISTLLNIILGTKEVLFISLLMFLILGIMLYMRFYHPIQLYSFGLTFFPRSAILYNNRGTASTKRGDYERGLKDLTHAIELKPNFARAYYNRGSTYVLKRDYQHAIQDYSQILASHSRFVGMRLGRAIAYAKLKDYQRALEDCEAASKLVPNSIVMYSARGSVYRLAHDYQRAIADYDKALTCRRTGLVWFTGKPLGSYKAEVYVGRGLAYTRLKNYQQALQDSNEALALSPKLADAYTVRGLAYLGLQELQQAQADFARACECFPKNCFFVLLLVWTELCITGPNAAHAEHLLTIAEADSLHHAASLCRAVACWLRSQFAEAAQAIEPAVTSSSDEWETSFWTGIISASQGFDEEAITALKHSITQGVPPALLAPLTWLKQQRPDFYEQHAAEL